MDRIRVWPRVLRGGHLYFGKVRHTKNGFHDSDRHPHHYRADFLLGHGAGSRAPRSRSGRSAGRPSCFLSCRAFPPAAPGCVLLPALQDGPASVVVPIDKLSILVTVGFSYPEIGRGPCAGCGRDTGHAASISSFKLQWETSGAPPTVFLSSV